VTRTLSLQPGSSDGGAARLRIAVSYLWRHGRLPNLTDPALFNELVQVRKLQDRDPRMAAMADKVAVKAIVTARLGREWVVPMLWSGIELPERSLWDGRVAVKARHGCNQNAFVGPDPREWRAARAASARWMRGVYGRWLDEWLYTQIPRGLLVEPFIGAGSELPIDYKVFVYGGHATHVQVHLDRARRHRWIVHDRDWRAIARDAPAVPRPSALAAMMEAAEELARDFDFARVDFYQPAEQPIFGEISFYPGSGLEAFDPPELDAEMGRLWLRAKARQGRESPVARGLHAGAPA
jgi:hypothetical protein